MSSARVVSAALVVLLLWLPPAAGASGQDPVPGAVIGEFAAPDPDWLPGHRGLDLAAQPGVPVLSPRSGIVGFVGLVAGVPVVVVHHSADVRSTYQPVTGTVVPGQPVGAGTPLGTVAGVRVDHCGSRCLHWGLIIAQRYADPRLLRGRVEARLVPDRT